MYFPFVGTLDRVCLIQLFAEEIKENNAWLIYAIGVNFTEEVFMHLP